MPKNCDPSTLSFNGCEIGNIESFFGLTNNQIVLANNKDRSSRYCA